MCGGLKEWRELAGRFQDEMTNARFKFDRKEEGPKFGGCRFRKTGMVRRRDKSI